MSKLKLQNNEWIFPEDNTATDKKLFVGSKICICLGDWYQIWRDQIISLPNLRIIFPPLWTDDFYPIQKLLPLTPNSLFDVALSKMLCNILPRMSIFPIHLKRVLCCLSPSSPIFAFLSIWNERAFAKQISLIKMNHPRVNVPAPKFCSHFPNHFLAPNFFYVSFDIDPCFCCIILSNSLEYWERFSIQRDGSRGRCRK